MMTAETKKAIEELQRQIDDLKKFIEYASYDRKECFNWGSYLNEKITSINSRLEVLENNTHKTNPDA